VISIALILTALAEPSRSCDDDEMPAPPISGTLAASVTPLRDEGLRLDEDAFGPLLEFYRDSGPDGLLVLGTTGEGILLGDEERRRVAGLAIAGAGRLRVIVHCGAQTTGQTSALAAHAAEAGADAVAAIAPPYFPLDSSELLEHFAAAAAACAPLPFYVYEYEQRIGYAVPVSVIEALRERAPNLAGMKVSDAPFERVQPYLATGLDVFIGAERVIRDGLRNGAAGAVSGVAAAFPEAVSALVREPTPERSTVVESLRAGLSARPFQASVKAALALRGLPVRSDVRAPLRPLSPRDQKELRAELERLVGVDALMSSVRA
jgi:dihydrodipicolinate synthase/N-acetylneuraminate lyase